MALARKGNDTSNPNPPMLQRKYFCISSDAFQATAPSKSL